MGRTDGGQRRDAGCDDGGLSVLGEGELGFGPVEAQRANRKAERLIGAVEDFMRRGERTREGAPHTDFLRTLSWKKPRDFHAPHLAWTQSRRDREGAVAGAPTAFTSEPARCPRRSRHPKRTSAPSRRA